jgi:hypothetical protein
MATSAITISSMCSLNRFDNFLVKAIQIMPCENQCKWPNKGT